MATRLEYVDASSALENILAAMHDFYLEIDDEELPGDPPQPYGQRLVDWRHSPDYEMVRHWILWVDDRLVATSGAEMNLEQNLENAFGWLYVRRGERGRGFGRAIAAPMLDLIQEQSRTRFACAIPLAEGRHVAESTLRLPPHRAGRHRQRRFQRADVEHQHHARVQTDPHEPHLAG